MATNVNNLITREAWNKGKHWPLSTKKRISQSRKGIPAWNKGKSWTAEVIEKISLTKRGQIPWNKGRHMPKSTKDKIRRSKLTSSLGFDNIYEKQKGSIRLRFLILKRDGFKCRYCGKTGDEAPLEVDHMIPRVQGGETTAENLITSCRDCNRGKATLAAFSG